MKLIRFAKFLSIFLIFSVAEAFSNESSQSHQKTVSAISGISSGGEISVFSAGEDGFLVKWNDADMGEHYQVSDLSIKLLAQSPDGNDVAVYETDGASFNRVSVWDWKRQRRKIAYTMKDPVTSLSYSARGTYIIISTTGAEGSYFIDSKSGGIVNTLLNGKTGNFSFAATSDSEKTLVTYSPIGTLTYFDFKTGEKKKRFDVEAELSQVTMFNNFFFLAGITDRRLCIINGTTGKTTESFNASNAIILNSSFDSKYNAENLFYIVNERGQFRLYQIRSEGRGVSKPELLRTFSGLKGGERVTAAAICGGSAWAGTSGGNIYKFDYEKAERVDVLQPITDDRYDSVLDIAAAGDGSGDFYALTPAAIYKTEFADGYIEKVLQNPGRTNLLLSDGSLILWSRETKKPVIKMGPDGRQRTLFTPTGTIQSLKAFSGKIVTVESNSSVKMYDTNSGAASTLYEGTSIQDAVLCGERDLYVAKSAATNPNVPLIYVNTRTQETAPLSLSGTFAYALNASADGSKIYGIVVDKSGSSVFSFDTGTKISRKILSTDDEDTDAFMLLDGETLYTNVGKSSARSFNTRTSRDFLYRRSEAMPLKVAKDGRRLLVLGRNGSLSVYNAEMNQVLNNLYLDLDGNWNEF